MNPYRQRIWTQFEELLKPISPLETALDFGSGDGWFANQMITTKTVQNLQAIDIKKREQVLFEPYIYAGGKLPYTSKQFDLVYAVDVLHHCPNPVNQLEYIARCSKRYLLIKDHNYHTDWGKLQLCLLDEIGNRKFGIPSLYHYQKRWKWFPIIKKQGFKLTRLIYPAPCHIGIMGKLTNNLQFIALWEREI